VNEQNNSTPTQGEQSVSSIGEVFAVPVGQRQPTGELQSHSPASEQSQGEQPEEHAEGAIPKAVEAIEKAAEKGLEKTSGLVGSTIDKVADAAISALGGKPDQKSNG
jgi:hypothetical protein